MFSSYQINVPQLNVDLDRVKAKQQGVAVTDVFNTMQIYLGSQYVNDFNRFDVFIRSVHKPMRLSVLTLKIFCSLKPVIVPDKWCHYLHW